MNLDTELTQGRPFSLMNGIGLVPRPQNGFITTYHNQKLRDLRVLSKYGLTWMTADIEKKFIGDKNKLGGFMLFNSFLFFLA